MLTARVLGGLIALAAAAAAPSDLARAQTASSACDLCKPAYDGDLGRVEQLLERGANVNARDQDYAPLQWAIMQDHADVALLLVKHGADPNVVVPRHDFYGAPIVYAAEKGDLDLLTALIRARADLNAVASASPALVWLTLTSDHSPQNVAGIQLLLEAGADPNAVGNTGWTALDFLCAYAATASASDIAVVMPLIKDLLVHGAHANDAPAMAEAMEFAKVKGDPSLITLLLAYGAKVDPKDSAALLDAARGHPELVPRLVDAGAVIDQPDADHDSALNLAVKANDVTQVQALLALGADANHQGSGGAPYSQIVESQTPSPDMVRALIEGGADLGFAFYEPNGEVFAPQSDDEMNKDLFPGFPADAQVVLDRLVRERRDVLSGMSRYFAPPHSVLDVYASVGPQNARPVLAEPPPGSIPLSEYEGWLAAAGDYLATPNAQAAFLAASRGLATPPPIPETARQHEAAGRALYANAAGPSGALAAAAEYEAAARLAPWVGAYHRDLCTLYDLGGALTRAYEHCVIYESSHPGDLAQVDRRVAAIADRIKSADGAAAAN